MQEAPEEFVELRLLAEQHPDACALADGSRSPLSFARLAALTQAAGQALRNSGVGQGEVVALAAPPGAEFLAAFLTVTTCNACTPLDTGLTPGECRSYLQRIGAGTLLYHDGAGPAAVDAARDLGMRLLRLTSHGEHAGEFAIETADQGSGRPGRNSGAAVILLTSATSDQPKLVPLSCGNIRTSTRQDAQAFSIAAADRHLSLTPLCHAHGLLAALTQLSCGGGVCCVSPSDTAAVLESIERFRPTWFTASVPLLRVLLVLAREQPELFRRSPLRFLRSTGAVPEPALLVEFEDLTGVPVLSGYGLSEAGGVARNTLGARRAGSVGRGIGTGVAILDAEGNALPCGEEGEIGIRGPAVTSGYLDNDEANRQAFRHGWFWTGDLGRFDQDGFLYIAGRRKEMISRGGKKILPQEVDAVLLRHPGVADAAVFAVPHPRLEHDLWAVVVRSSGSGAAETELRRFVAQYLATYKVPRHILFADALPRTVTGKIKRAALTAEYAGQLPEPSADAAPPTPEVEAVEQGLLAIWRRVLGVEGIRRTDNFFDLGGDSLAAGLMLTLASDSLSASAKQLPEAGFFEEPTIRALALTMANARQNPAEYPALPNRILVHGPNTPRRPYFLFSVSELDAYRYRHLAGWMSPERRLVVVCPGHPKRSGRLLGVKDLAREALQTVRTIQPSGPYTLGGYCFGGVVAFEAAAQLMEQRERVSCLALFDTPAPGYPKVTRAWRNYSRMLGRVARGLLHGESVITLRQVKAHVSALRHIAARRNSNGKPVPTPNLPPVAAGAELPPDAFHRTLLAAYRPHPIPVRIVHFFGVSENVSTQVLSDPRLGWVDFAGAGYQSRPVAGDHRSLLAERNAPALAQELASLPDS